MSSLHLSHGPHIRDRWTTSFIMHTVLLSLLPTALYGVLYYIMVMVIGAENGGWDDFYGFNGGGAWYISAVFMFAGTYAIGVILWAAHKISERRENACN